MMYRKKGIGTGKMEFDVPEKGIRFYSWILFVVMRCTGKKAFDVPEKKHLMYRKKRHRYRKKKAFDVPEIKHFP